MCLSQRALLVLARCTTGKICLYSFERVAILDSPRILMMHEQRMQLTIFVW